MLTLVESFWSNERQRGGAREFIIVGPLSTRSLTATYS
jgi:hypothetical protein